MGRRGLDEELRLAPWGFPRLAAAPISWKWWTSDASAGSTVQREEEPTIKSSDGIDSAVALYNDSLERCTAHRGFLDRFYVVLVASDPEVAAKFERTKFSRQAILLKASLYMMMLVAWEHPEGHTHLERIARLHSREGLDIRPEFYTLWLDCLIATVKKFDPHFHPAVERAWRQILTPGIEFMKSRY
jgi:hemoglobin-like flavoprotein